MSGDSGTTNRIFLLVTDFKPMTGGIGEYLHNLFDRVGRLGPVTVMSTVRGDPAGWSHSYQWELLPPVPERRLGHRMGDVFSLWRKLNSALYIAELRSYARERVRHIREQESKPEVYVGLWSLASHFWCRELAAAGIGYSLFAYGMDIVAPLSGPWAKWRSQDFAEAGRVIGCSMPTAELARERFSLQGNAIGIAPGVAVPDNLDELKSQALAVRAKLGPPDTPVVLTVGRLVARKGVDVVLRALAGLRDSTFIYVIAGDGPERPHLEELAIQLGIKDSVRFLGAVDETTKWALYHAADLFVTPNRLLSGADWEGFGIVFLEAAIAGKPSIGGNNGGVPDAIADNVTGILVDPENIDSVRRALSLLLTDRDLRTRLGEAACQRAMREFNWDAVASRFMRAQGWS